MAHGPEVEVHPGDARGLTDGFLVDDHLVHLNVVHGDRERVPRQILLVALTLEVHAAANLVHAEIRADRQRVRGVTRPQRGDRVLPDHERAFRRIHAEFHDRAQRHGRFHGGLVPRRGQAFNRTHHQVELVARRRENGFIRVTLAQQIDRLTVPGGGHCHHRHASQRRATQGCHRRALRTLRHASPPAKRKWAAPHWHGHLQLRIHRCSHRRPHSRDGIHRLRTTGTDGAGPDEAMHLVASSEGDQGVRSGGTNSHLLLPIPPPLLHTPSPPRGEATAVNANNADPRKEPARCSAVNSIVVSASQPTVAASSLLPSPASARMPQVATRQWIAPFFYTTGSAQSQLRSL